MQTLPTFRLDTLVLDSIASAIEAQPIRYVSPGQVTAGAGVVIAAAFLIALACLYPWLRKIGCALWIYGHEVRERRARVDLFRCQRKTLVDRAREKGL